METTKKLAEFIIDTEFREIPPTAVDFAKRAILDCVGVTLAGINSPPAKIMIDLVKVHGGNPAATVIGAGFKTSSPQAGLVNGTAGHALDYDDTNGPIMGHPSVFLVPTILALGDELGIGGKRLSKPTS